MRFIKYGKTYQLRLKNAKDLANLLKLDESLWVATSAPVSAFRTDRKFIEFLVDGDKSTRITSDEIKSAVRWLLSVLKDRRGLGEEITAIPLAAIQAQSSEGRALIASAQYVLKTDNKPDATSISLSQIRRFLADLEKQPLNGDGVIVPAAAGDPELAAFIADVVECMGGVADASGNPGASEMQINTFMEAIRGYLEWREEGEAAKAAGQSDIHPFGDETAEIYELYHKHAAKVDLFFEHCKALQYEPEATPRIVKPDAYVKDSDITERQGLEAYLGRSPLAEPNAALTLSLTPANVNPLYRDWLAAIQERVLKVAVPERSDSLSLADWERVKLALSPFEAYLGRKQGATVEKLPLEKMTHYRGSDVQKYAHALLTKDKAVEQVRKGVVELERLILYHQYLLRLVNNFVSFSQLYRPKERALFEMGSLVIDGRWFNLAVRADDPKAHSAVAKSGSFFTMYLDVQRMEGAPDFRIAVPATSGSKGNLVVGKRGVFFDIEGKEYDAQVTQIIENPISLREALAAPFVNLWRFVLGKIEAMSTMSEKELEKGADGLLKVPQQGQVPMAGGPSALLVSMSLSVAALGSAFAFIAKTLTGMTHAQRGLGLVGGLVVILFPVALTAWIKLRRRDLSSLLEGSGWAVNARMRLNRSQRRQFTMRAPFPADATGVGRHRWAGILTLILVILVMYWLRQNAESETPTRLFGFELAPPAAAQAVHPPAQP